MQYALLRIAALTTAAFLGERVALSLHPGARFVAAFVAVYMADSLWSMIREKQRSWYLEDVVRDMTMYAIFGLLAAWIDSELFRYTGKQAGAVVPALALAVLDKAWRPPSLKGKRR